VFGFLINAMEYAQVFGKRRSFPARPRRRGQESARRGSPTYFRRFQCAFEAPPLLTSMLEAPAAAGSAVYGGRPNGTLGLTFGAFFPSYRLRWHRRRHRSVQQARPASSWRQGHGPARSDGPPHEFVRAVPAGSGPKLVALRDRTFGGSRVPIAVGSKCCARQPSPHRR